MDASKKNQIYDLSDVDPLDYFNGDLFLPGESEADIDPDLVNLYKISLKELRSERVDLNMGGTHPKFSFKSKLSLKSREESFVLWDIQFCPFEDPEMESMFAVTGGRKLFICKVENSKIVIYQAFKDDSDQEEYYSCSWGLCEDKENPGEYYPFVAVGGFNAILRIIDCSTGKHEKDLIGHGHEIYEIKTHPFSHDLLLSASKDNSIRLWNVSTEVMIAIFAGHLGHVADVISVDWHMNGKFFVSSGVDHYIKVWKLEESVHKKIEESRSWDKKNAAVTKHMPFKTVHVPFPVFSSNQVHNNYVDCVRWFGNLIMSKSLNGEVTLWKPNINRRNDSIIVITTYQYHLDDPIWFQKFNLNSQANLLGIGNTTSDIFIFDLNDIYTHSTDQTKKPCQTLHVAKERETIRQIGFDRKSQRIVGVTDECGLFLSEAH